uniref:Secreted protein n=1 Tax=Aedes albopictus TaxID=7160 RepID=A0A023EGI7_AEDAL
MRSSTTQIVFVVLIFGVLVIYGQADSPSNGTAFEEVVVETSLYVSRPSTVLRRQQLRAQEKGDSRTKRDISHSTDHANSNLKSNALNPAAGHQKQSKDNFIQSFFDKGFNNGASKAEQRAFYKQKPALAATKPAGNQLVWA